VLQLLEVTGSGKMRRYFRLGAAEAAAAPGKRGVDVFRRKDGRIFRQLRGVARQAGKGSRNRLVVGALAQHRFEGDSARTAFADGSEFAQGGLQARNLDF
jgi:hypothetical protein